MARPSVLTSLAARGVLVLTIVGEESAVICRFSLPALDESTLFPSCVLSSFTNKPSLLVASGAIRVRRMCLVLAALYVSLPGFSLDFEARLG